VYESLPSGRGTVIRGNTVHDFFDGLGGVPGLPRWDHDRHLDTLAELQAETAQELAGLDQEPMFCNPATSDDALHLASPLLDAGVPIPGINHDFQGAAAPDIGARRPLTARRRDSGTASWPRP
jgi:hypothetical protein